MKCAFENCLNQVESFNSNFCVEHRAIAGYATPIDKIKYTPIPDNCAEIVKFLGGIAPCLSGKGKSCDCNECSSRLIPFVDCDGKRVTADWGDTIGKFENGFKLITNGLPSPISPFSGLTPGQLAAKEMEQISINKALANVKANETAEFTGNKYHRKIIGLDGTVTTTDVYRVLDAFDVREPGLQHAIKKLLCAGIRGKNDTDNDLKEAIDAITATRLAIKQKKDLF